MLYLAGNSNATITNTIMQDLSDTSDGGAAYIRDNSSLSVINSTIQGSQAQYAAGLLCHDDSTLIVRKSVLQYNRAARNGGGVSAVRICKVCGHLHAARGLKASHHCSTSICFNQRK